MGFGTYSELKNPFHDRLNFVATRSRDKLREGFVAVTDPIEFIQNATGDVWVIGGPNLLASALEYIDELSITQLEGDFDCTKFLPDYHGAFRLLSSSGPLHENGIEYAFEVWAHK